MIAHDGQMTDKNGQPIYAATAAEGGAKPAPDASASEAGEKAAPAGTEKPAETVKDAGSKAGPKAGPARKAGR